MNRKLVTDLFIKEWISSRLKEEEDLTEVSLGGIHRLRKPDEGGCNWSKSILLVSWEPRTILENEIKPSLILLIARAAAIFNLGSI